MKKKNTSTPPVSLRLRNLVDALRRALLSIHLSDLPSRVRELPDERTVRFYTTVGLLAPPLSFDGRRAFYGRRHLLQLLAVKRLQSQRLPIRQIREKIRRASGAKLSAIANVDSSVMDKALRDAAKDPSLNLWPRPSEDSAVPDPIVNETMPKSARCYRISDGIYLTIDPAAGSLTADQIQKRLMDFAGQFHQNDPGGGG